MLIYRNPEGETTNNPSIDFLKEELARDSSYWEKGGGDSGLYYDDEDYRLIFFKVEGHGFFIMQHPDYIAPHTDEIELTTVFHNVGGEPMATPSVSYVSSEKAAEIILHFAEYKEIIDIENWKDIYEIIDYEE